MAAHRRVGPPGKAPLDPLRKPIIYEAEFTSVTNRRTLTARWVFPVSGPPLANGVVTIRGDKIEAVEPRGIRSPDDDLGNVAIIPGLVNAHTHLDLSGAAGSIPPTDPDHFTDWLRGVIAYRRSRTPEQVQSRHSPRAGGMPAERDDASGGYRGGGGELGSACSSDDASGGVP